MPGHELFKNIMGDDWHKLHPDIQSRFRRHPPPGRPLRYTGILSELRCSWPGRLFGFVTLPLVGGALLPYNDANCAVDFKVYSEPDSAALFKQRVYRLNGRKAVVFSSEMREGGAGELIEYVGRGLGMRLELRAENGDLHFRSTGYFWEWRGWRVKLPPLFTPGETSLWHRHAGASRFSLAVEIRHCLFGTMFRQAGMFIAQGSADSLASGDSTEGV